MRALFRAILFLGAALVVTVAATSMWVWNEVSAARVLPGGRTVTVSIPKGATFEGTLNLLTTQGVLRTTLPLKVFLKLRGGYPMVQAGTYQFASPITPIKVAEILSAGAYADRLTIIEGWTRWDIARAMKKIPALKLRDENAALSLMNDRTLIADMDGKVSDLEGYLFPDTYYVVDEMKPKEVISAMVMKFRKVWKEKLAQRAAAAGKSIHEVVTVASLVETEAKLDDERSVVASVIYNRLSRGMPLGVDSTLVYASRLAGKWRNDGKVYLSDVNRNSLYNTRLYKGLPPGPIGSPGLLSLTAALYPASTNYLYYVRNPARNDGAHNFYASPAAFEQGVRALREWERKRDASIKNGDRVR